MHYYVAHSRTLHAHTRTADINPFASNRYTDPSDPHTYTANTNPSPSNRHTDSSGPHPYPPDTDPFASD
jgi:hypothetical protein